MKLIATIRSFIFACHLLPISALACSPGEAEAFVHQFYSLHGHPSSVPDLSELSASVGPYSNRLHELLLSAAKYREEFIVSHPPEASDDGDPPIIYKPPFVNGDIFTGSPDGSQFFEVTWSRSHPDGSLLFYVKSLPEPNMSPWQVYVTVVSLRAKCAIDEVHYGSYSKGTTLTSYLSWRP